MFNATEKSWYVVYTKPRWEKKIIESLHKAGIEYYCPFHKVVRQWSDRKKIVIEPVFRSYIFVRMPKTQIWEIKLIAGILNYVYWLGKPAVIKDFEIDMIKVFLDSNNQFYVKQIGVKPGDTIRINSGAFSNFEGQVVTTRGKQVQIEIPSLGIALLALDMISIDLIKNVV